MSVYHIAANRMRTTQILNVKTESPTVKTFSFRDTHCAKAQPGQFLMLWIPGVDEIPLSILGVDEGGLVSVAVKRVGQATRALHEAKAGNVLGVRGPFGNSFSTVQGSVLMVAGGTGTAPLLFLANRLLPRMTRGVFVMGAKTQSELLFMNQLEQSFSRGQVRLVTSTEDGSCGVTGLCTEPVEQILARERFNIIYACGPEKMLRRIFELAEEHRTNLEASLERLMRCAIGLCGSCTVGKYRVCADGPVFTSKQLREVKTEFGNSKRDLTGRRIPLD
ncbi:MAG: dihydroorotate dehydrogenase electron transfer subunit [Candidatus Bathyarchaeia archaeon]